VQYAINGVSGTIIKVSTDKDFYQKNEVANISTLVSSTGTEEPVTLSLVMKDDKGRMCAQKFSEQIEKGSGPKAGTIYPALKDLNEKGLISGEKDGKTIVYSLTAEGKKVIIAAKAYFCKCFGEIIREVE
jgi:DNA-binding transcriptional ArsR family regulator